MNVSWMSEALSDIDDTRLVDVFGYGGIRYRISALQREIMPNDLRYWIKTE